MTGAIPFFEPGESWSDSELEQNFHAQVPVKKAHLYGLLAVRSWDNPLFLELLKQEAIDPDNQSAKCFGFIKIAWLPVLAVLEHGDDEGKGQLKGWLEHWTQKQRALFGDYIRKESEMLKWFDGF